MRPTSSRRAVLKASGVGITAGLAGCLGGGGSDTVEWEIAVATAEGHPYTVGANEFKTNLEDLSDSFEVSVTSGGAYGGEVEQADILKTGEVEMTTGSLGVYEALNIHPSWIINATTFVYGDEDPFGAKEDFWTHHLENNDPVGKLEEAGFQPLVPDGDNYRESFVLSGGARHIMTQEPVRTTDDAEGIPIRAGPSPLMNNSLLAIGFDSETMPVTEVYQAAESGVIQAAEGDPAQMLSLNLPEVMDYYTLTAHLPYGFWFVTNQDAYEDLSDDQQETLREATAQTKETAEERLFDLQQSNLEEIRDEYDVELIDDHDSETFTELAIEAQRSWFEDNSENVPMTLDEITDITLG